MPKREYIEDEEDVYPQLRDEHQIAKARAYFERECDEPCGVRGGTTVIAAAWILAVGLIVGAIAIAFRGSGNG